MAYIHQLAVEAAECTNLERLGELLIAATRQSMQEGIAPYSHPVVRFICHQIAFAGDGDIESEIYYRQIIDFCRDNSDNEEIEGEYPSEPPRQTS